MEVLPFVGLELEVYHIWIQTLSSESNLAIMDFLFIL